MAKPLSHFFSELGVPLNNVRWSWGASAGSTVLLRTWSHDFKFEGGVRRVRVLRAPGDPDGSDSYGLDERYQQLESIWRGGMAAYTVMATAVDAEGKKKQIKDYRDDGVFSIERIEMLPDGSLAAFLRELVPVRAFSTHAEQHRTSAGEGPFPADAAMRTGASSDAYQLKIPLMREAFIEVCRDRGRLLYGEVMERFGLTYYPLVSALSRLGHDCDRVGEPIITAIVVDPKTGHCSDGILKEFGISNDEAERERCYAHWATPVLEAEAAVPTSTVSSAPSEFGEMEEDPQSPEDDFEGRVARFSQVEVRPQQAQFRLAVFRAHLGRCVVSGCDVPEALEAAHRTGRDWRAGHNSAEDGLLLRRDLHVLYDRGLLVIGDDGCVRLDERVRTHYGQWHEEPASVGVAVKA